MSIDDKIQLAVKPLVPDCSPDLYQGDDGEYCTYSYNELPDGFGSNTAHAVRYYCQVHWFLPAKTKPNPKKAKLRKALAAVRGFTTPSIVNATDGIGQHYVYEFEAIGGMT